MGLGPDKEVVAIENIKIPLSQPSPGPPIPPRWQLLLEFVQMHQGKFVHAPIDMPHPHCPGSPDDHVAYCNGNIGAHLLTSMNSS